MKKIISIILVTILALSMMPMAVNAAGEPTFTVGSATIKSSDTAVTVPVTISNGAELSYYKFTVQYSKSDLALTKINDSKAGGDVTINDAKGVMSVVFSENTAVNGEVATLTFNVLEGAKTSTVTLDYQADTLDMSTFEASHVDYVVVPGTITVEDDTAASEAAASEAAASEAAASEAAASEAAASEAAASEAAASETASSESSSSESNPTDPASSETQASESSASESSSSESNPTDPGSSESAPSESSASETTAVEGFPVTFVTNGHVTINVYHTRDYATSIVDVDVTSAVSRERDAGYPDESGDGQVNFLVVFENGYELDTISADGGFKNLKGSEETLSVDMYRITKITGAVTVTINTKASASTSEASASETSASETQASETSASETAASEASTSETSATTPTSAPKTTFKFAAAKTKIYVGATTLVKVTNLKNGKGATTYTSSNKKVATVTSAGKVKGLKAGSVIISAKNNGVVKKVKITIVKKSNTMTVKAKTVKVKVKAKKTTFKKAKAFTIKKAKGTVSFKKVKGDKRITISKKGVITVKKGLKKGKTYKFKVKVTAKGTTAYKAKSKTVTVKVKVVK